MSYKPSQMVAWQASPKYAVMKYRNPETIAKEETLDDFLLWLQYDSEDELSEEAMRNIKALFDKYLELDEKKVQAGEKELLDQWIKACGGSGVKINKQGHRFVNAVHDFENCKACKS